MRPKLSPSNDSRSWVGTMYLAQEGHGMGYVLTRGRDNRRHSRRDYRFSVAHGEWANRWLYVPQHDVKVFTMPER